MTYFSTTFCSYYYWKRLTLIFQQLSITTATERVWFFNNILLLQLLSVEQFLVVPLLKYDWLFVITTTLRLSFWTTFYYAFCHYYYTSTEFLNNVLLVLLLLLEFDYFSLQLFRITITLTDFSTTLYFLVSDSFLEQLFYSTTTGRQTDFLTTLYFLVLDSFLEQLFYNTTTTGRQTDFLTTLQLHYHYWTLKEFEWILQLHLNLIALLLLDLDRF